MDNKLNVNVSTPYFKNLSKRQRRLLDAVTDRIHQAGLRVVPEPAKAGDRLEERYESLRHCHGVLIFGFGQWQCSRLYRAKNKSVIFPSEFTHIECALAVAAKRPVLVLREKTVSERGVLRRSYIHPVLDVPASADEDWLDKPEFTSVFSDWVARIKLHRHVFLGYSGEANSVAAAICRFMMDKLKVSVFDWHDFRPSDMILGSIEDAERLSNCGVFLFMADDPLKVGQKRQAAPRDNVVYEAGYFAGAKGSRYALIIREEGAKVPSNLGGVLYLHLKDRNNIAPIESKLRDYLELVLPWALLPPHEINH